MLLRISLESKDIAGLSNSDSGGSSGAASFLTTWFFSARNFCGRDGVLNTWSVGGVGSVEEEEVAGIRKALFRFDGLKTPWDPAF